MKLLTLIRHAKSSWSDPSLDDFDRPLNKRGKQDAPVIGGILAKQHVIPDTILASPALRAFTTAKVIASELGLNLSVIETDDLIYGADVEDLLSIIRDLESTDGHVFMIGHNPGFHELANALLPDPIDKFVTCGVVRMEFNVESWKQVKPGSAQLIEYIYPKMYR